MRVKTLRESDDMVQVQFEVEDTGIGIEEEVRSRLFKPFSQADSSTARRFGGTGLGLTISKNLVELMRGGIALQSRLGVGTKATFWIPFNKAAYPTSSSPLVDLGSIPDRLQSELSLSRHGSDNSIPTTPATPKPVSRSGFGIPGYAPWPDTHSAEQKLSDEERSVTNILVVEDNPINQQIALKTIKKLGFPVKAVWNGKEALEYLASPSESQPRPDIILMDVQMPIMDGYKATYTIRNSRTFANDIEVQSTPIVAMTASAIQGDREKCQTAGMDDYLAKPVKKPHLEKMLVKWAIEGRKKRAELRSNPAALKARPANPRAASSFASESSTSMQTPQEQISGHLDRLEYAHRAAIEQSAESEGDRSLRQLHAEEQAIALRDNELIEAGEDPRKRLGKLGDDALVEEPSSTALTAENMSKFALNNRMQKLARAESPLEDNDSSAMATAADTETNPRTTAPSPSPGPSGLNGARQI